MSIRKEVEASLRPMYDTLIKLYPSPLDLSDNDWISESQMESGEWYIWNDNYDSSSGRGPVHPVWDDQNHFVIIMDHRKWEKSGNLFYFSCSSEAWGVPLNFIVGQDSGDWLPFEQLLLIYSDFFIGSGRNLWGPIPLKVGHNKTFFNWNDENPLEVK